MLLETWTTDREQLSRTLGRIEPNGGTAMYDAVAEAIPLALEGHNRKKALLVISDGNDTCQPHTRSASSSRRIRESETLVYAIGIDGEGEPPARWPPPRPPVRIPTPRPFPGRSRYRSGDASDLSTPATDRWGRRRSAPRSASDDRVNVVALRDMTDDSGGRTEIIRDPRGSRIRPRRAIADELSKQYYLGYPASGKKDGRWHSIRVEVRGRTYRVRARKGYVRELEYRVQLLATALGLSLLGSCGGSSSLLRCLLSTSLSAPVSFRGSSATRSARCSASRSWRSCRRR